MSTTLITDPNSIMINGPINVLRLEGTVAGIKKKIYLFMDYHIDVSDQSQCSNIFSKDVQKYFTETFYDLSQNNQSNKLSNKANLTMYDFFLEIYPSEIAEKTRSGAFKSSEKKDKYIEEVVKVFKKIINYDPYKNKVSMSNNFRNVRLHYLDIRNYYDVTLSDRNDISNALDELKQGYINVNKLSTIIDGLKKLQNNLTNVVNVLTKKKYTNNKTSTIKELDVDELDNDTIEHLSRKIKTMYQHKNVEKQMNMLLNQSIVQFRKTIDEINEACDRFESYITKIHKTSNRLVNDKNSSYVYIYDLSIYTIRNMIVDILNTVDFILNERFVEFFARFTDIYFLRRFLDKDYITNAVVYSGAQHSHTYVHKLVNDFGFKITHASYSKIKNMDKLNSEIANMSLTNIQELILPPELVQCSNISHFPKNFS